MTDPLGDSVKRFIDDVGRGLIARDDATVEAFNLACAFVDADALHTDDELSALIATFGPILETQLARATAQNVRDAGLVDGKRDLLRQAPEMFDVLVHADREQAQAYYRAALEIGFAVAATDLHTSEDELSAIENFQRVLLAGFKSEPVHREVAAARTEKRPLDELLAELDALVGLEAVKRDVRRTVNLTRIEQLRRERNLPVLEHSRHLVFTGNPGTGKTTVARLLAQLYRTLGVVPKGHLVESDRSQLVAGYVGQTAIQVRKVFDEADGGILLIDEAYALARGGDNDFGKEAIDTIVKLVEDRRDSVIVIAAGYPDEMAEFIGANPGLRSRFPKTIHFADYSTDELVAIFETLGSEQRYMCDAAALVKVREWLDAQPRVKGFGNGRLARNLFEGAVTRQAERLAAVATPTDEQLCTLTDADVPNTAETL
jgi:ATP-dependent Clp protease ATP-binding subunit ClpA